jgi:putative ABC transport system permease protein
MLRDVVLRVRSLLRRGAVEREMDQELRFHLEREISKNIGRGISENEATRTAKMDLGGFEQVKEESRDARGVSFLETTISDVRYGFRILRKSSAFTTVAVLSLALGVGANTAIFQLIDAIRLRTLPVNNPQDLAEVRIADMRGARGGQQRENAVTYPIWEQIQKRQEAFSGVFAWTDAEFNLSPKGEVRSVPGLWVSGEFFKVLGVRPVIGRLLTAGDDYRGCGIPGVVISYSFWQSEFGGSTSVIGKKLNINGQPVSVIGVTTAGFFGLDIGHEFQIALPICSIVQIRAFNALDAGTLWWLSVMGRLKPGVTLEQGSAQLNSLSPGVFQTTLPPNYPPVSVQNYLHMKLTAHSAATGLSGLRDRYSDLLWILLAIAGTVLLNACANLANLMLARAGTREREIAVRLAIGGSTRRIVQQLLIESALIAVAGAGAALVLAHWLSRGLLALLTAKQPWTYVDLHTDWRVLVFTFGVASATCLIFGFTPALRAAQSKPVEALKSGSRSLTAGQATLGLRRALIASQVALSLVLLVGSLLFIRSLQNLLRAEPGLRTHDIFVADLGLARPNPQQIKVLAWQKALLDHVGSIPGVTSVADTNIVPLSGNSWSNRVWMEGRDSRTGLDQNWSKISPGYFRTLGIPLLTGRDFNDHDGPGSRKVAIVNEAFAKQVALTPNPIGLTFRMEETPSTPEAVYEIVGTVADSKYRNIRETMQPLFYLPLSQDPTPSLTDQLLIRSNLPLQSLLPALRRAILEADSNARFEVYNFGDLIQSSLARDRLMATLSSVFATLAALLSAVGLYGVITYIVTRRRSEIGIRIALGADRSRIFGMLFLESGKMLLAGLLVGTLLTLSVATLTSKLLFGLKPHDPLVLTAAVLLLLLVGLLATFLPALRAASINPTAALREE